jgi:hypothetical protein
LTKRAYWRSAQSDLTNVGRLEFVADLTSDSMLPTQQCQFAYLGDLATCVLGAA